MCWSTTSRRRTRRAPEGGTAGALLPAAYADAPGKAFGYAEGESCVVSKRPRLGIALLKDADGLEVYEEDARVLRNLFDNEPAAHIVCVECLRRLNCDAVPVAIAAPECSTQTVDFEDRGRRSLVWEKAFRVAVVTDVGLFSSTTAMCPYAETWLQCEICGSST